MAQSQKKVDGGRIGGAAAISGVIEVAITWTLVNGKSSKTFLHGRNLGGFTPSVTTATALFAALSNSWSTRLALYAPTGGNFAYVTCRDMTATTNPLFQSTGSVVPGTSASASMPPGVALVLTENIVQRGRGAKGRAYLPLWATNADATGGSAIAAVQTAMNNWGSDIFSELQGQSLYPCVAKPHRQAYTGITGTLHADRPAGSVDVSSYTCRDVLWDAQRRRGNLV